MFAHAVFDIVRHIGGRRARDKVAHQINPYKQPIPAHIANDRVLALQASQAVKQTVAHHAGVLRQPFIINNIKNFSANTA